MLAVPASSSSPKDGPIGIGKEKSGINPLAFSMFSSKPNPGGGGTNSPGEPNNQPGDGGTPPGDAKEPQGDPKVATPRVPDTIGD